MLLNYETTVSVEINTKEDLNNLKPLIEQGLKVNKSELARRLGIDRRTVDKYIKGYEKKKTRNRNSQFDEYYDIIKELLDNSNKVFVYKSILWKYLKDNFNLKGAESSFRRYISSKEEFDAYFKSGNSNKKNSSSSSSSRFETDPGEQAQIDWKENLEFILNTGEVVIINIFCFIMSYSRFRVYRLSLSKTQDIVFHFMDEIFQVLGGIPKKILTDNMKTVMDIARTEYRPGKVNNKFYQFSKDYGFEVCPCIAGKPETKAKVESPMKILEELLAYNGDLTYDELARKLKEINDRENAMFHPSYHGIPVLDFQNEKAFLGKLPNNSIRKTYQIATTDVKVNKSSMFSYKSNAYSVPPEYVGKTLQLQVYDEQLHVYYNTQLVTVHRISDCKLNYHYEDYKKILTSSLHFNEDKINDIAKENLKKIGERYSNDRTRATHTESGVSQVDGDNQSLE